MATNTLLLTDKQQRSTLSAKKKRVKETIKNIVVSAYNNNYWPELSHEDQSLLNTVLINNLPQLKVPKVNVHWRDIKNVPKNERKQFRQELTKNQNISEVDEVSRKSIFVGVNDVTKHLEKNEVGAVLIAKDVQKIMVQHVVDLTVLYNVPFLLVEDFRHVVTNCCGMSSAALGFSRNIKENLRLENILNCIKMLFKKIPPPYNHINYKRSLRLENTTEIEKDTDRNVSNVEEKLNTNGHVSSAKSNKELTINKELIRKKKYLKRDSTEHRVFVPVYKEPEVVLDEKMDTSDFFSFSQSSNKNVDITKKTNNNYKSLVVKRVTSDKKRKVRVIKSFKK